MEIIFIFFAGILPVFSTSKFIAGLFVSFEEILAVTTGRFIFRQSQ
ncbi:hypothetical protein ENHAE0001_0142 [Enhydrobacter aerosaccus SK60]|nr:hypothetical protein ENHAE0001_0142 [Enhydrobacter aerosaccus SK60]